MPLLALPALNNGVQLLAPSADGSPGQVIATNGSGQLSFVSGSGSAVNQFASTNKQGSTIAAGSVCAIHSSGVGAVLASATDNTLTGVGLAVGSATNLAAMTIQTSGAFTLADWTAITGSSTLSARAKYFLSTTSGLLTTSPPSTPGNVVQFIGEAVNSTTLLIQPGNPIVY